MWELKMIIVLIIYCYLSYYLQTRDKLVCEIENNDVYEDFYENRDLLYFSDYSQDPNFFNPVNKKANGKMKDEVKGKIISEFVGLKPNMYSLVILNNKEIKKAKGVNKNADKNIRYKEYIGALFNKNLMTKNRHTYVPRTS